MLLDENFWDGLLYEEAYDWQATMFQPIGAMDRIAYAFAKELGHVVQYNAPVIELRQTAAWVRAGYMQGVRRRQSRPISAYARCRW